MFGHSGNIYATNFSFTANNGFLLTVENLFEDHRIKVYQDYADGPQLRSNVQASGYVEFLDGTRWDYNKLIQLALKGTNGADRIIGTIQNDEVHSGDYADFVTTFNGDDILDGGKGNDDLQGGGGNDTYVYSVGDGSDTIYDDHGVDTLKFGVGIVKEDVIFTLKDNSQEMEVSFRNSFDTLRIKNWVQKESYYLGGIIENIVFANGDTLSFDAYLTSKNLVGTENGEQLTGANGNDTLEGLGGDDYLIGGQGNDVYLIGEFSGADYLYDAGGFDSIYIKDLNSLQTDLVKVYFTNNLKLNFEIEYNSGSSSVVMDSLWIEQIKFSDGVVWDSHKIMDEAIRNSISRGVFIGSDGDDILTGTLENNVLFAGAGNDVLVGGKGDDTLSGGEGNDIYRYMVGDGLDVIEDLLGFDILEFTSSISPDDVILKQSFSDIVVSFSGNSTDSIVIANAVELNGFSSSPKKSMLELIRFADGVEWNIETIMSKAKTPSAAFNAQANKISGNTLADPGVVVVLRNKSGMELSRVNTSSDSTGKFTFTINNSLYANQDLYISAIDWLGFESPALKLSVPDKTPPVISVVSIDNFGTVVSGSSEPGSLIEVTKSGVSLGKALTDSNGVFNVTLSTPQINKQSLNVIAKDIANNASPAKVIVAPDKTPPIIQNAVIDQYGKIVSGKTEAGSSIELRNNSGVLLKTSVADDKGVYSVTLNVALINKEIISVIAIDNAGNASATKSITAPDKTPPSAPGAQLNSARKIVSGTAEAGSTVKILDANDVLLKSTVANATTGVYSVTFTTAIAANQVIKVVAVDKSGNTSLPTIIGGVVTPVDTVPPDVPIAQFGSAGEVITGKAEAGSLVEVKSAATGNLLGNVTASATGDYSILLNTPLINKEVVHVTARDAAGNISSIRAIIAPDKTPPALPVMNLDAATKTLAGSSEPGATIIIKDAENNVLGSVKADSVTGNYQLVLNQTLVNGQLLFGTATDDADNTSASASLQVSGFPSRQIISGLQGSYYGYEQSANGDKDLTKLAQVQTFITGKTADATFIATNFNFGPCTNALGMGANLQGFLKNDAASLSNDPLDTSDSILRFTGKIQLSSGSYNFRVRADDGYSIRINGQTVAEYNANQGATTRTHGTFSVATTGLQDIEIIYWDSGKGHELGIEYKPAGGSYSYLNGSILSTESAQPNPALAQFTSGNTQSNQGKNIPDFWFGSPGERVTYNLVARDQPIKHHAQQLGTLIQSMAAFAPASGVERHLSERSVNNSALLLAVGT
ncbi:MAG TPA: Ig-like domain-containing protein [Cellvibrio sp.]